MIFASSRGQLPAALPLIRPCFAFSFRSLLLSSFLIVAVVPSAVLIQLRNELGQAATTLRSHQEQARTGRTPTACLASNPRSLNAPRARPRF